MKKCNVCGRELPDGQTYCMCGNMVTGSSSYSGPGGSSKSGYDYGTGDLSLYPEKKKGPLPLIIGIGAGALIFILIIILIVNALGAGKRNVTDATRWERISGSGFSMTVPQGMKDADFVMDTPGMNQLKEIRNSEVAISVTAMDYDAKQLGSINRKKFQEMIAKSMPKKDDNGHDIDLQEHGRMLFYEFDHEQPGIFLGASNVHVVDAMYVGKSAVYEITVICPAAKYPIYKTYIFSWLDSFTTA